MIVTTTLSVEGRTISEYLGIVSAAQVMVMPGILLQQAVSLGADAIVGVRYEPFGMNICATGTAVRLI